MADINFTCAKRATSMFCLNFNSFQLCPNNLWLKSDPNKESVNMTSSSQRLRRNGSVRENCLSFSSSHVSCKHLVFVNSHWMSSAKLQVELQACSFSQFTYWNQQKIWWKRGKASINGIHNPCFPLGIDWVVKSDVHLEWLKIKERGDYGELI